MHACIFSAHLRAEASARAACLRAKLRTLAALPLLLHVVPAETLLALSVVAPFSLLQIAAAALYNAFASRKAEGQVSARCCTASEGRCRHAALVRVAY